MRLAKPATIQNENGTISGHINCLPVNGIVYVVIHTKDRHLIYDVPVDDLDALSQEIIYGLVEQSRDENND